MGRWVDEGWQVGNPPCDFRWSVGPCDGGWMGQTETSFGFHFGQVAGHRVPGTLQRL